MNEPRIVRKKNRSGLSSTVGAAPVAAEDNRAVTEIVKIPNRGHSLTIDHGWREVAEKALDFVKRFT